MKTVLVTGGTGFLGEAVVRRLLEVGGARVRVLARAHAPALDGLDVEIVRGDVTGGGELDTALAGCDGVFHLAGLVSRDPDDSQRMMRVHVDGTRRVIEQAKAAGVKRVVVASTSGTVAVSKDDQVHDESEGYATEVVAAWPYYASKVYQEKLAFDLGARLGIEVVCVLPSLLLGPGDRRLSSTGDVRRFLRRQIPAIPPGGINFVDVRDAAAATVAALDRGRPGERYLLGGPNWTLKEFFGRLERIAKVDAPRLRMGGRPAKWGAIALERLYKVAGKDAPVDRMSVEMAEHFWYVDSSRARRELGFEARDPGLTLIDTVRYLRQGVDTDL
ncbi:MAG TPA: NAD-dependent epimerase/dehydratase family protein [Kofleriaceae bacterium]|jgi:dihydroflavonol-4-reductase|nr:NAD-dependent epimerase/dehydratase family protein [Kofleriaceae bacterium]